MASSKHTLIEHRTKFPALSTDKFRLTSEPECRLSHWRALLSISIRIRGHKVTNGSPCRKLCNPYAEHTEQIQRANPVGRAFIINTFSLFSITFHNFSWKKFSSIISIGWNFEMGSAGRGGRGGRRGFWTRPRAAGESMEEVIYICAQTDDPPEIFVYFLLTS